MGINRVTLLGHLGADPELRGTTGGEAVLNFRMATSVFAGTDGQTGEVKERTEWHRVNVWGKRAEGLARVLVKGSKVLVEGELRSREYTKNGERKWSTEVTAKFVELCGGKKHERDESRRQRAADGPQGRDDDGPPENLGEPPDYGDDDMPM